MERMVSDGLQPLRENDGLQPVSAERVAGDGGDRVAVQLRRDEQPVPVVCGIVERAGHRGGAVFVQLILQAGGEVFP